MNISTSAQTSRSQLLHIDLQLFQMSTVSVLEKKKPLTLPYQWKQMTIHLTESPQMRKSLQWAVANSIYRPNCFGINARRKLSFVFIRNQSSIRWKAREKRDNYYKQRSQHFMIQNFTYEQSCINTGNKTFITIILHVENKWAFSWGTRTSVRTMSLVSYFVQCHTQYKFSSESAFLATGEARNLTFLSSEYWRGAKRLPHPALLLWRTGQLTKVVLHLYSMSGLSTACYCYLPPQRDIYWKEGGGNICLN